MVIIWQFWLSKGNHIIAYVSMCWPLKIDLIPQGDEPTWLQSWWGLWINRWALSAVHWEFSTLPRSIKSPGFGCIWFIFGQSSGVLKANCWRVNTLDPDCKHLSYVWLVFVFTDQNHSGSRVLKSDSLTNSTESLVFLTQALTVTHRPFENISSLVLQISINIHPWANEV